MTKNLPYEKHTRMLLEMKRYREALLICVKWVENQPDNAHAWFLKCVAESNTHQPNAALVSIDRALAIRPGNVLMLAQRAQILGVIGHSKECLDTIDALLSCDEIPPTLLHQIGSTLNNIGEHSRAVELFEQVRTAEPKNAVNLTSLGTAYHIQGRSEEAAEIQRAAIKLDPANFRAYWLLGQMKKASSEENLVDFFSSVLKGNADKLQARVCLNFALAKQFEEMEQFDQAFTHLEQGSAAVLEHSPYDAARDRSIHHSIIKAFDQAFCSTNFSGAEDPAPIFIIGMPRTGTTLLEQILTTYDEVDTAGELHHFPHLLNQACNRLSPGAALDVLYKQAESLDWQALGEDYLSAARLHVGDSARFIDKYPLNYTMVGPILTALPNARIINLQRNPMDTCFSNYKLLYRLGTALHSYDQLTMADHYLRYREMMAHWHQCYPAKILDVSYESLVTEAEQTTRNVTDFLGLDWRPQCLEFYKAGTAVATASTAQIRNPINTGSLHKWRKFESHLKPLVGYFEEHGIATSARAGSPPY